jgi:hypothetical protein
MASEEIGRYTAISTERVLHFTGPSPKASRPDIDASKSKIRPSFHISVAKILLLSLEKKNS